MNESQRFKNWGIGVGVVGFVYQLHGPGSYTCGKGNGKVIPLYTMKVYGVVEVYVHIFQTTSTGICCQLYACSNYGWALKCALSFCVIV
jgi:hypothetical protein